MRIWVDADACPQVIKEVLFRAADRMQVVTTLVANQLLWTPSSPFIRTVRVATASTWLTTASCARWRQATS